MIVGRDLALLGVPARFKALWLCFDGTSPVAYSTSFTTTYPNSPPVCPRPTPPRLCLGRWQTGWELLAHEILGHSQISITMDVYTQVVQDAQREATSHMDRLLRRRPGRQ
jgi:hypothetical protein